MELLESHKLKKYFIPVVGTNRLDVFEVCVRQSALLGSGAKQAIVGQCCPLLGGTLQLCAMTPNGN